VGDDNCGNFGQRFCEPSSHSCVACLTDANCGAGQPYCSSDNRCVECLTGANCGDPALTCNNNNNCVPTCATDADCGAFGNATVCDTGRSFCVQCLTDANCAGDNPYCFENRCEQCLTDANCTGTGQPYCAPNHNCVECLTDANCPNGGVCGNDMQCNGG
jgi:Cys-rich repeat protein